MELGTLLQHLPPRLEVLRHLDQVLRGFRATGPRLERLVHVAPHAACGVDSHRWKGFLLMFLGPPVNYMTTWHDESCSMIDRVCSPLPGGK